MFELTIMDSLVIWWPGILVLGFGIGMLTGLFGVGGGFLLTPLLRILFLIPYPVAVGTGLPMIALTSGYSARKYWKAGSLDPKLGLLMACSAVFGTSLGKWILTRLEGVEGTVELLGRSMSALDLTMNLCFIVLMGGLALYILHETRPGREAAEDVSHGALIRRVHAVPLPPRVAFPESGIARMSVWMPVGTGFGIGILTGLLGVGGGFVNFPLLVYVFGLPTIKAVGTSALQIVLASGFGAVLYAIDGRVEWVLVGILLVASMGGVRLGIWIAQRIGGRRIRRYFSFVLAAGVLVVLYGMFWVT